MSETEITEILENDDFKFLMGDINFTQYGGKFFKDLDDDNFHIIEIIPTEHHMRRSEMLNPVDYWVTLSCVWLDDDALDSALNCCGYNEDYYKEITQEMKLDALHSYHGGDMITNIEGNDLKKMLDWIIRASYHYPHIETYTENRDQP